MYLGGVLPTLTAGAPFRLIQITPNAGGLTYRGNMGIKKPGEAFAPARREWAEDHYYCLIRKQQVITFVIHERLILLMPLTNKCASIGAIETDSSKGSQRRASAQCAWKRTDGGR